MPHDILLASPAKRNTKVPNGAFFLHGHIIVDCPTFDRHQIIKIAAASFVRISAFFHQKLRVVGYVEKCCLYTKKNCGKFYIATVLGVGLFFVEFLWGVEVSWDTVYHDRGNITLN